MTGLRALGTDPDPILQFVGIDALALQDPDGQVPAGMGSRFLNRAVEVTRDPHLGLHLAEEVDPGSFDVHFYAMVSSATLGEAFERLCRYQRLIHETNRVTLESNGGRSILRHMTPGGGAAARQSVEFIIAAWVRAGRVAVGIDWSPMEVRFVHPAPSETGEHSRFFRCPVQFGVGENSLVISRSLMDTPCVRADASLLAVLDRYASDRLGPNTATFAGQVRAALSENIQKGGLGAEQVARRFKMSVRTFNRMLAAEGTTYRKLSDQLRHELAARYLRDRRVSIMEVAFLTGFSEISAFHRAFKRWAGQTPAEFRRTLPR